jgi:uncharacterized Zn finger protein (UPF0148 family)
MLTVIGCDRCELPALVVLVTEDGKFICAECERVLAAPLFEQVAACAA